DAGEREVSEQRARRTANDVDVLHSAGEENAEVVVAFRVSVDRLVDRHAGDPEREIGGGIGRETTQRSVGREARTLSLLVPFAAGRLSKQVVRAVGGSEPYGRRIDVGCRERFRPLGRRRDDGRLLERRAAKCVGAGAVGATRRLLRTGW